ncbi:hypothetical protein QAD02_021613 [Eretmocerus hayati]|uniref:Uncharacterized protein n=1 Tax=Eretmocerus hayati TaxID=131215 RepID=A0ACC2PQY9_9HYME|nr:hypothetical protein QAD02_021613 [Eretmocerus hayati]
MPRVNCFMVWSYIVTNEKYDVPEVKGVKATLSSRESYMDEKNEIVKDLACVGNECKASEGGCKHCIAFLMWVNRRFESSSPTDVECYWKKSRLSRVSSSMRFIKLDDMKSQNVRCTDDLGDNSTSLDKVKMKAEQLQSDSQVSRYLFDLDVSRVNCLSIHQLVYDFYGDTSALDFFEFARVKMSPELCVEIEERTRNQSDDPLWHEMRFGRLTASIIHEASHCKTAESSLVRKIIGAAKAYDSVFMKRGRELEKYVLRALATKLKLNIKKYGIILIP